MGRGLFRWRVKGVDAVTWSDEIAPAVPDGLTDWFQGGYENLALARRNLVSDPPGLLFGLQGTPVADEGFTVFKGATNFFRTLNAEAKSFTVHALIARGDTSADNAHRGTVFGSYLGALDPSCLCYYSLSNQMRFQIGQGVDQTNVLTLTLNNADRWKRFTFICDAEDPTPANNYIRIINHTDGQDVTDPLESARDNGPLAVCIGSSQSASFTGLQPIAHLSIRRNTVLADAKFDAHWDQVMTNAEADDVIEGATYTP